MYLVNFVVTCSHSERNLRFLVLTSYTLIKSCGAPPDPLTALLNDAVNRSGIVAGTCCTFRLVLVDLAVIRLFDYCNGPYSHALCVCRYRRPYSSYRPLLSRRPVMTSVGIAAGPRVTKKSSVNTTMRQIGSKHLDSQSVVSRSLRTHIRSGCPRCRR